MYMQIVNSKKYKEKLLRIIMSNTVENPEFETFMKGLQTLKGQGEDKYIESLIMSINKTKKSFEKYDGDDEIPDGCVSFVLFEREQRNCAFYYVMLIALFASYNASMEDVIDKIYENYNRDYDKLSEDIYILNEELMKSQQFIIDKGLEREYIDYVK